MLKILAFLTIIFNTFFNLSANVSAKNLTSNFVQLPNTSLFSTTSEEQNIEKLTLNNHKHYINLTNVDTFAVNSSFLYFSKNGELYCYNLNNYHLQKISQYNNVTQIKTIGNLLLIVNDNQLIVLDNNLNQKTLTFNNEILNINATYVTTKVINNQIVITTLHNLTLSVIKLNSNLQVVYHSFVTLTDILNAYDLTLSNNYIYISYQNNTNNFILQVELNALTSQKIIPVILSNTKIEFLNVNNNNLLVTISSNEQRINVLSLTNENNSPSLSTSNYYFKIASGILTPAFVEGDIYNFKDMQIVNNKIFILDNGFKAITSFDISLNANNNYYELTNPSIFVASISYSVGRFNNPNNIHTISSNNFIIADTLNNRIQHVYNNNVLTITEYDNETSNVKLNQPKLVTTDILNNYIIYHKPNNKNEIVILNEQNNFVKNFTNYTYLTQNYDLGNISSFSITNNQTIFAIDYTNNIVLKSNNLNNFTVFSLNTSLNFNANSKIFTLLNNEIIIYTENVLYLFNASGEMLYSLDNIIANDIYTDELGNIFVLNENVIEKYVINNFEIQKHEQTITLPQNNYSVLSVAINNGLIILFDSYNQQINLIYNTEFSNGLSNYNHPENVTNITVLTNFITFGTITNDTLVYDFPNYLGNNYKLNALDKVIVLDDTELENFIQILYTYNNKLQQGYVLKSALTKNEITTATYEHNLKTINKNVRIFKYPTFYKYNEQAIVIVEKGINEVLVPISQEFISIDGKNYYAVLLNNNEIGYVSSTNVVFTNVKIVTPLLNTNYKTLSTLSHIKVYKQDSTNSEVIYTLPGNYEIYVEKFDQNKKLTKIKFLDENNIEITGYIETVAIKQNITSEKYLTSLVLTLLGIALLVVTIIAYNVLIKKDKEN